MHWLLSFETFLISLSPPEKIFWSIIVGIMLLRYSIFFIKDIWLSYFMIDLDEYAKTGKQVYNFWKHFFRVLPIHIVVYLVLGYVFYVLRNY